MIDKVAIGKRLKRCREAKKLTQEKLSEKLGNAPRSYAQIEAGDRLFSVGVLMRMTEVLGVSADYILFGYTKADSPISRALAAMSPEDVNRAEDMIMIFADAVRDKP